MTDPAGDYEHDRALDDVDVPTRIEYAALVELPNGDVEEMPADTPHTAYVLAWVAARDYAAAGITVTATPVTRTWVLADETEITDPFPGDDHDQ